MNRKRIVRNTAQLKCNSKRQGCIWDGPGKVLLHFTPGGIEGFFREAGVPATNDGPAPSVDVAEITRTQMAGKRYGLRVIDWEDGGRANQA